MTALDIIVCVKPVPDPRQWKKLKLDPETMLLCRGGIAAVINQLDRHALEQAVQLKERSGGTVTAVSMAPPDAEEQLAEALAAGCDHGVLLTDRAFRGADTLATARVLAAAIRKLGRFDLVFCGGYSLDGSTSSVGPQVAELLGVPDVTHAVAFDVDDGGVTARCQTSRGEAVYRADLPVVVTFDREVNTPRVPSMTGIMRASRAEIVRWTADDLKLDPVTVGLAGSPTQMQNVFAPSMGRKGEILRGSANEMVSTLLARLHAERVLE